MYRTMLYMLFSIFFFLFGVFLACDTSSNKAIEEGTDCNEKCPVGASKTSMKNANGSCDAEGNYYAGIEDGGLGGEGELSANGQCMGSGECQVVCLYPECSEQQTLVITKEEYRCEASENTNCEGITCSNHGYCRIINDTIECVCDDGYFSEGLNCLPDENYTCEDYCTQDYACFANQHYNTTATCIDECLDSFSQEQINCAEITNCLQFGQCIDDFISDDDFDDDSSDDDNGDDDNIDDDISDDDTTADTALYFDGVDDYVEFGTHNWLVDTSYTIEAWVKPISGGGDDSYTVLMCEDEPAGSVNFALAINRDSGKVCGGHWDGSGPWNPVCADESIMDFGSFVHVALVFHKTSGEAYMFVNGESKANHSFLTGPGQHDPSPTGLATNMRAMFRFYKGYIKEVRVSKTDRYSTNFTPQEILTSDLNTVGLWHFDEGDGIILTDSSSNHYDGTIHGAIWMQVK